MYLIRNIINPLNIFYINYFVMLHAIFAILII